MPAAVGKPEEVEVVAEPEPTMDEVMAAAEVSAKPKEEVPAVEEEPAKEPEVEEAEDRYRKLAKEMGVIGEEE